MLKKKIRIVAISSSFFNLCSFDKELLSNYNQGRPYLYILKLKYYNKTLEFALPLRSNISNKINKKNFFCLPPNSKTKSGNYHGIHFEKMFPIKKEYKIKFRTERDVFLTNIILPFIDNNLNDIIQKAQDYLKYYENGIKTKYCTNINEICMKLNIELDELDDK